MKKLLYFFVAAMMVVACGDSKKESTIQPMFANNDDMPDDSTIYGRCLAGSGPCVLHLLTGTLDTLTFTIKDENSDESTIIAGCLLTDDRMAVTASKTETGLVAQRVINLTTLLGHWKSLDRDFEITENGEINSFLSGESHRWNTWRVLNGQLILSKDTFDLISLTKDTMEIEDNVGLYYFSRVRKDSVQVVEEKGEKEDN